MVADSIRTYEFLAVFFYKPTRFDIINLSSSMLQEAQISSHGESPDDKAGLDKP